MKQYHLMNVQDGKANLVGVCGFQQKCYFFTYIYQIFQAYWEQFDYAHKNLALISQEQRFCTTISHRHCGKGCRINKLRQKTSSDILCIPTGTVEVDILRIAFLHNTNFQFLIFMTQCLLTFRTEKQQISYKELQINEKKNA